MPPFLNLGYDFPDFLYAFAPKPYLVLSAIRDFFPIGGARSTFAEGKRVYGEIGAGEKIKMVEADDGHGYTLPRRLAAYSWMSKWLKGQDDDGIEPAFPLATETELQCTKTGQVVTSLGGESVFTLNRRRALEVRAKVPKDVVESARKLSGYRTAAGVPAITPYGTLFKKGYRVEKFVYESEPGLWIPAVLAVPEGDSGKRKALIYVDGSGKAAAAAKLESWMAQGMIVLAIDARGFGEFAAEGRVNDPWFGDASSINTALLIGRSMVGMRALDIVRGVELLARRPDVDSGGIHGIGIGRASVPLLYAAAFDPRIQAVELDGMLESYQSIIDSRLHRQVFEQVVPGAIRHYDLDDLVKALAPRRVVVRGMVDAMGIGK